MQRSLPKFIGICGKMGTGKDEAAEFLADEYGYRVIKFATALRRELAQVIRQQMMPSEIPLDLWETILTSKPEDVFIKPTTDKLRKLLQWYGTDFRREQDENYWITQLEIMLAREDKDDKFVISDCRYPNEARWIIGKSGILFRIKRAAAETNGYRNHKSEKLINSLPASIKFDNDGSLDDLRSKIRRHMEETYGVGKN